MLGAYEIAYLSLCFVGIIAGLGFIAFLIVAIFGNGERYGED